MVGSADHLLIFGLFGLVCWFHWPETRPSCSPGHSAVLSLVVDQLGNEVLTTGRSKPKPSLPNPHRNAVHGAWLILIMLSSITYPQNRVPRQTLKTGSAFHAVSV